MAKKHLSTISGLLPQQRSVTGDWILGLGRGGVWTTLLSVFVFLIVGSLIGCGSSSYPVVGSVSFPNGSQSGLAPGAAISLSATVANDPKNLGLDWLATCTPVTSTTPVTSATSSLCGTFAPAHTASGAVTSFTAPFAIPTGGTVTITATSTTDPTRTSMTSVTISGAPIMVTITPSTATVEINQSTNLNATVANDPANAGLVWTLSCNQGDTGPACGGFSPFVNGVTSTTIKTLSGTPVTYYAPSFAPSGSVTVTATSVTNPQIAATAQVTVVPAITIAFFTPPPSFLAFGASTNVTAIVLNDYANAGVNWTATAGSFSATQTASGTATLYTAPVDASAGQTVTVTATSVTDPTVTVSATITLGTNITVGISNAPASLQTGAMTSLAATVSGDAANAGVMWTATAGSFSLTQTASGVATTYTAPATVPSGSSVTITATSVSDPTKFSTAFVPIFSIPITVSVTDSATTVLTGGTVSFTATVANDASNGGVKWSATAGTFSPAQTASGVATTYTAPATLPSGGVVTITATSTSDSTKSGTATLTVSRPAITVALVNAPSTLQVGVSAILSATLANDSANGGVTWTASAGSFSPTQTASGAATTYKAPSTVPAGGTVTLTATSVSDPTKSASTAVTITPAPQPITVSVAGSAATVLTGGTVSFTATLSNDTANAGVTWTATAGSFSLTQTTSGVATTYTAPSTVPGSGTVFVTATSVSDPTKSATATLTVTSPAITVALVNVPAKLQTGTSAMISATVTNDTANGGVTWTASAGTFTPTQTANGVATVYKAPSSIPAGGTVTIKATSISDPTKSSTATITITAAAQPITVNVVQSASTVLVSGTVTFTATVDNDTSNGGVTWSATAGSFSLTQTASGVATTYTAPSTVPSGGMVTVTATSVTDPTKTGTATLTVTQPAITVTLGNAPSTLQTGASAMLSATVANDSANGGVTWTASAGTFVPTQTASGMVTTYKAPSTVPAGGTVTLKATSVSDPRKSSTTTVTITPAPLPITVSVTDSASTVLVSGTVTFTATVANDTSNGGVTWSATAGSFSLTQTASGVATTYTAPATLPSGGMVTVTATSVTDPMKTGTATLTVTQPAITVTLGNAPSTLQTGASAMLSATVANDSANGGVTWTASEGSFNPTQTASGVATTYTAPTAVPSGGTVTLTATSVSDPSVSASATVTITSSLTNSLLNGKFLFALTGQYPVGTSTPGTDTQYESYIGSFTADGNGNITAGDVDFLNPNLNNTPESFTGLTGAYSVQANGQGTITLNGGNNTVGTYTFTMSVTMQTQSHGMVMSTSVNPGSLVSSDETGGILNGTLDKQTSSSFTQPLSGGYAFTYEQVYVPSGQEPDNLGGVFTVQSGTIKSSLLDENLDGTVTSATYTGSDTFGATDSNGRGTITLHNFGTQSGNKFIYYVLDSTHFIFMPTQGNSGGGLGSAYLQPATLPTSLSGTYAFTESGFIFPEAFSAIDAGAVFTCDANGNLSGGPLDVNNGGTFTSVPIDGGTCAMDSPVDGRATINIVSDSSGVVSSFALYATANNGWLMLELDPNADGVGVAYPQAAGVSAATFMGTYAASLKSYNVNQLDLTTLLGPVTADGTAALTGSVDVNATNQITLGTPFTSTALVDTAQGRLTGTISTSATGSIPQVFYIVDANTVLTLETDTNQGTGIFKLQTLNTP